jgi:hypothetical protein
MDEDMETCEMDEDMETRTRTSRHGYRDMETWTHGDKTWTWRHNDVDMDMET